jgi:hypothetical protein
VITPCLAGEKEKDIRSRPIRGRRDFEEIDTRNE